MDLFSILRFMNRATIAKVFAICSSVVIGGCFVAYRQSQSKVPDQSRSKSASEIDNVTTVFPSSKNLNVVLGNPIEADNGSEVDSWTLPDISDPAKPRRTVLPSSKIGAILSPEDEAASRRSIDEILNREKSQKGDSFPKGSNQETK